MIHGKAIYSHNVPAVGGGDPIAFVKWLKEHNFEGVYLKAANGTAIQRVSIWSPWPTWGENIRNSLIEALKAAGLKVYLWHFVYGANSAAELSVAKSQVARFQPDGYIWDVEGAFDNRTNAVANARLLSSGMKSAFPDMAQGLCWWALPLSPSGGQWHPIKVAKAFQEYVDVGLPMMYWQGRGGTAARAYLHRSMKIWKTFWNKPIIPTGRAYNGDGGEADPEGILAFADEAKSDYDIPGLSWWVMDTAVKNPLWETALTLTETFGIEEPVVIPLEEKVDRLVKAHPELFPEL
jgi:hypothetical protein